MVAALLKKYRTMVLCSIFFFYFGCIMTLSLLKIDCADGLSKKSILNSKHSEHSMVKYAVLILSGPDNKQRRDTIRQTWMELTKNIVVENGERFYKWNSTLPVKKTTKDFVQFYFVVGAKNLSPIQSLRIGLERETNGDLLILEDLEDSYENLAEKMAQSLEWFSENLIDLKYVIKCDDDSFVRIDLIIHNLEAFAPDMTSPDISEYVSYKHDLPSAKGLYWGYFDGRAHVQLRGKWQEQEWFLCDSYLPYALGGGYVISRSIVDYVARNIDLLSRYNSEDTTMGLWTSSLRGINRVHDIRFDSEWKSRGCSNSMLVRHKQTPDDMVLMYKHLVKTKGEELCIREIMDKKSYVYKWNVLPSSCCKKPKE